MPCEEVQEMMNNADNEYQNFWINIERPITIEVNLNF
jgi:hypothetical protein